MNIQIYTDGSYLPQYPGYSGWGFIILDDDENIIHKDCGNVVCESRNIDGECHAVINALVYVCNNLETQFKELVNIKIFYDYIGLEKWKSGEWKTNKIVSINYAINIKRLLTILHKNFTEVEWVKVKSHSGNLWNDQVDRLCKIGLTRA